MRVVLQRVREAQVEVEGAVVGAIGAGLLLLVGIEGEDGAADIDWLVRKIVQLRVFEDEAGVMNHSLLEVGGAALAVSQFTLFAFTYPQGQPAVVEPCGATGGVAPAVRGVCRRA